MSGSLGSCDLDPCYWALIALAETIDNSKFTHVGVITISTVYRTIPNGYHVNYTGRSRAYVLNHACATAIT